MTSETFRTTGRGSTRDAALRNADERAEGWFGLPASQLLRTVGTASVGAAFVDGSVIYYEVDCSYAAAPVDLGGQQ